MKKVVSIAVLVIMAAGAPAWASMIGINFEGDANGSTLAAGDSAGVVSQTNWNNMAGTSGTGVALNDDTGAGSGATLTWTSYGTISVVTAHGDYVVDTGDEKLMNGCLYPYSVIPIEVTGTVSGISAAYQASGYEVYIYVSANGSTNSEVNVGATNWYPYADPYVGGTVPYVEITSHSVFTPTFNGSYVRVTGLSAGSFTFNARPPADYNNQPCTPLVYGLQIVQVPEPATMVLLASGGLALLMRRKRR